MEIKQMSAASDGGVYGLGKNNKVYWWNRFEEKWQLLSSKLLPYEDWPVYSHKPRKRKPEAPWT